MEEEEEVPGLALGLELSLAAYVGVLWPRWWWWNELQEEEEEILEEKRSRRKRVYSIV